MRRSFFWLFTLVALWVLIGLPPAGAAAYECSPTAPDSMGPFYKPHAPLRSSVGEGYVLSGTVKSAADCSPVPKAHIEFWLTNPEGEYDDRYRATVIADDAGAYRFESNRPEDYGFRPPHIHMRVTAEGFQTLVTQHYPEKGVSKTEVDIVLVPKVP